MIYNEKNHKLIIHGATNKAGPAEKRRIPALGQRAAVLLAMSTSGGRKEGNFRGVSFLQIEIGIGIGGREPSASN